MKALFETAQIFPKFNGIGFITIKEFMKI